MIVVILTTKTTPGHRPDTSATVPSRVTGVTGGGAGGGGGGGGGGPGGFGVGGGAGGPGVGALSCVIVIACPPAVTWAVRCAPMFASANTLTVPLAVPLCPVVIRNQAASLDAVQLQPVSVCRLAWREPPPKPTDKLETFQPYRQAAADWFTSTVCPPTLNVAVRTAGIGFASTVYGIAASPCPFAVGIDTQFAVELIDQVQSRVAETVSAPCPPAAGKTAGVEVATTWHFWADGATTAVDVSVDVQAAEPAAIATRNARTECDTGRFQVITPAHVHALSQRQLATFCIRPALP
jgi:hypothetical protein